MLGLTDSRVATKKCVNAAADIDIFDFVAS